MAKGYSTANLEIELHNKITKEAARNKLTFSAQINEYREKSIKLGEQVDELRTEIKMLKERSNN